MHASNEVAARHAARRAVAALAGLHLPDAAVATAAANVAEPALAALEHDLLVQVSSSLRVFHAKPPGSRLLPSDYLQLPTCEQAGSTQLHLLL